MCMCVVQEASIAWEKRQAQVRAKLQQDTDAAAWNSWWENLGGEGLLLSMSGAACCGCAACRRRAKHLPQLLWRADLWMCCCVTVTDMLCHGVLPTF